MEAAGAEAAAPPAQPQPQGGAGEVAQPKPSGGEPAPKRSKQSRGQGASDGKSTAILAVAASAAGRVVGKGGRSIIEIRSASGAEVEVGSNKPGESPSLLRSGAARVVGPAPASDEGLVRIVVSGPTAAVRKAAALVETAASRTGRRRPLPRDGDDGELAHIFADESDGEAKPEPQEPAGEQLPGGWVKGWDPQRERVYYWHAASSTSSWSLPAAAPSADADGVVAGLLSGYVSSSDSES